MQRFSWLEEKGLPVAALSDRSDGDCGFKADDGGANRKKLCTALDLDSASLVCIRQVHGTEVIPVQPEYAGRGAIHADTALAEADGLITRTPGIPLGISVADCVPLWLYDPTTHSGGVVHAGRNSTFENIAQSAVSALHTGYGVDPGDLFAVIGPSAGPESYEVSTEIAQSWADTGYPVYGRRLDLWATNQQQLEAAGLSRDHILVTGHCTIRDGRFFSYRGGDATSRNLALFCL